MILIESYCPKLCGGRRLSTHSLIVKECALVTSRTGANKVRLTRRRDPLAGFFEVWRELPGEGPKKLRQAIVVARAFFPEFVISDLLSDLLGRAASIQPFFNLSTTLHDFG
jgi:hypothetical protein